VADWRENGGVVRVDDQPRHVVGFIRHDGFIEEAWQRHIGEDKLRGNPRLMRWCRDAGQPVAAAQGRGLRQQGFQVIEDVKLVA